MTTKAAKEFGERVAVIMGEAIECGASPREVRGMLLGGVASMTLAGSGHAVTEDSINRLVAAAAKVLDAGVKS